MSSEHAKAARGLARILVTIITHQYKLELIREALCEIPDFDPIKKFSNILKYSNRKKAKQVDGPCLKRFLEVNNFNIVTNAFMALENDRFALF